MNRALTSCVILTALMTRATAAPPILRAGDATFDFIGDNAAGHRPRLTLGDASCVAPKAISVFVLAATEEATKRFDLNATQLTVTPDGITTNASLTTPGGSRLAVSDLWSIADDRKTFRLKRSIVVEAVGTDRAFGTGFELAAPADLDSLADADVFIPGMWYGTQANTPPSSLIHDVDQADFLLREDRMALPLISLRDRRSGLTITLTHENPNAATVAADDNIARVIHPAFAFGALGLRREAASPLRVAFRYPGTEGEQTSIFGFKPARRSAERLHPLTLGAKQEYELTIRLSRVADFPTQLREAWRDAYARAKPAIVNVDVPAVYDASIHVLDHYAYDRGTVSGIPFGVTLPDGTVKDPSLQMGFIGQQLSCASYLIDEGLRSNQPDLVAQGERIVDFWVRESLSPSGVPRTWYDLEPTPRWRNYNTFIRIATDGTSGMLRAWQIERTAGRDKPAWLAFCRAVGDWLLTIQNRDGSFYREWTFDGTAASQSKTNTLHPVRLLIELSCATGERRYLAAALRAADFALANNLDGRTYVGGTPDNPDVLDKEAGWIAFDSYLALYDVTQDKRYLDAAVAAATFTETWIYAWNVPMPIDSTRVTIPNVQTTAGASLIATGHSGADLFLAYASLSYLRLSLYTGDAHFADVSRLLQANTAQFVDVRGSLGYAQPGLCVEAFSLAVNRGHSVRLWLPWLTSAILEPMARSREIFGVLDVDAVMKLDPNERSQRNAAWARRRGFDLSAASRP